MEISIETGQRIGWYTKYYLEFGTEIPDKLFDAQSIDLTNFWTNAK